MENLHKTGKISGLSTFFYLIAIVKQWFPGISYKYGDSSNSIKKCQIDNMCKNLETELMLKDRISTYFFFE